MTFSGLPLSDLKAITAASSEALDLLDRDKELFV
jgi:hypothetical protein